MTKVQARFAITRPLDEALLDRIARAHGLYGFHRIQVAPSLDELIVEYDASRLSDAHVEAALHRAGIPVKRAE